MKQSNCVYWHVPLGKWCAIAAIFAFLAEAGAQEEWFPHMKDAYWLAVNYGIADEAQRLGVRMDSKEAGGYENLDAQIAQVQECATGGADGVILAAISYTGLDSIVAALAEQGIPVVDNINGMASERIAAKSLVSFGEMGYKAGHDCLPVGNGATVSSTRLACSTWSRYRATWSATVTSSTNWQ